MRRLVQSSLIFVAAFGAVQIWTCAAVAQVAKPDSITAAPARNRWVAPKTADGHPDLRGIWTNATITPFERPTEFANKEFFTKKEAEEYERVTRERNNMDRRDVDRTTDVSRAYNDAWWDRGTRVVSTLRTSLVVDPADGKLPPFTDEARARIAARAEDIKKKCERSACSPGNNGQPIPAEGPEDRSLTERCIVWPTAGPPMLPSAYNNNYQIFQTNDYIAIYVEMIHDVRVIPLDGRPHLPTGVKPWLGDSRGHWEGDTLVVETTNFSPKSGFRNTTEHMKLTERFTRTAPDTLLYRFTVDDPHTYAKPWTVEVPMMATSGPLYEYACHEGNYGMEGVLSGARALETKNAGK